MYIAIKASKMLDKKIAWNEILLTILAASKTINIGDHLSYIKKFSGYCIDVHVYKYETTMYVRSAVKNGTLE